MSLNRLIIAVIIMIFLYGGNIIYYEKQKLSEPFFLDHHYDYELSQDGLGYLELYYVTNKTNNTTIWSIEIPGVDFSHIRNDSVHQEFSHYQVKKAHIELNGANVNKELFIDNIEVQFSDNDYKQYSIGEVIIRPSTNVDGENPVQVLAGGSSNNSTNFIVFEINEKGKILDIDYAFEGLLKDEFYIMLNYNSEQLKNLKNKLQSKNDENHEQINEIL